MGDLSAHFSSKEFACPHCGKSVVVRKLIDALEKLHAASNHAIFIIDGYRCAEHNKSVGGAPSSEHLVGEAADIQIEQLTAYQTLQLVKQIQDFKGYGLYVEKHAVHVDVRTRDHVATWGQIGRNDKYVSLAQAEDAWRAQHGT